MRALKNQKWHTPKIIQTYKSVRMQSSQCFQYIHLAAAARLCGGTAPIEINTTLIIGEHEVLKVTSSLAYQVRVRQSVVVKNRAANYRRKRKR